MRLGKKIGYAILFVGIVIVCVCFTNLSYKILSQGHKMDSFLKSQEPMTDELKGKIDKYNSNVDIDKTGFVDPFNSEDIKLEKNKLVNGIFGYLEIPKINFKKPIYLGASYDNLAKGVAQIDYTSIPVGGESTRAVIAGHRGWYGDIMLLKIGELYSGDVVYVHHHGKTLTYKVIGREIIDPSDWERLKPVEGKDMLTLLSCDPMYPPFVNRILINCVRADKKPASNVAKSDSTKGNDKAISTNNQQGWNKSNLWDYGVFALTIGAWIVLIVNIRKFMRDLKKDA